MNRRRFLTLTAAFACAPHLAQARTWTGVALGADVSVTLTGPRQSVEYGLSKIPEQVHRLEDRFSLYRPTSDLSRLNRDGWQRPDAAFRSMFSAADNAHRLTGGLFDPTIQPLWAALANGGDTDAARKLIGWHKVLWDRTGTLRIGDRQQLTFNGIAQGYVTDIIRGQLKAAGFRHALVNIGEHAAIGGPFTLGLSDPVHGELGQRTLHDGAIATSSPDAMRLGDQTHILSPDGRPPLWSTISIEAPSATLADALSTAAVFLTEKQLRRLKTRAELQRITAISPDGDLITL